MQNNFIDWMNNTLNFSELSRYLSSSSDLVLINEIEVIENDAVNDKALSNTLTSWIAKGLPRRSNVHPEEQDLEVGPKSTPKDEAGEKGEGEDENSKSFSYFLLKSEGIEKAMTTICYNAELKNQLRENKLLFDLFQKYLRGSPALHERIVNIILDNEFSNTENSAKIVKAIKDLVSTLKFGFREVELFRERDNLANEIFNCILNNNLKSENLEEIQKKLKTNFENIDNISQENYEVAVSKFEHLEETLKELENTVEDTMKGLDVKRKAVTNYYYNKHKKELEEVKTYTDTLESLQARLLEVSNLKIELQVKLDSLLLQMRDLEKRISEQNEIEVQMTGLIAETRESIETKKITINKLEKELKEELAYEQSQYVLNQSLKKISSALFEISADSKKHIVNQQESRSDKLYENHSEAERILFNLMKCNYEDNIEISGDEDKFKEDLLKEMYNYKKYIENSCNS